MSEPVEIKDRAYAYNEKGMVLKNRLPGIRIDKSGVFLGDVPIDGCVKWQIERTYETGEHLVVLTLVASSISVELPVLGSEQ